MFVDSVVFEGSWMRRSEEYVMRVFSRGEPEERATPFVVKVGELRAEMLVTIFGEEVEGLQGMLKEIPQLGDE
jgi:hypothetical protein